MAVEKVNSITRVVLAGPIETKGRYKGGIAYILNALLGLTDRCKSAGVDVMPFDTCRVERGQYDTGKFSFENLHNAFRTVRDLQAFLKTSRPDVLYFNSSCGAALIKDLLIVARVSRRHACKTVFHIHFAGAEQIVPANGRIRKLFLRLVKRYVDHIVLLSEQTRLQFINWGIPADKMSVIYNFHCLDFTDAVVEDKIRRSAEKTVKDVIFLGSLDERKGIVDLMDAVERLTCPIRLHVCGTANSSAVEAAVNSKAAKAKTAEVILHGFTDGEEKRNLLLMSDVLVLPSYSEGFPIVLTEALAAGCAILATNVGAVSEAFSDDNGKMLIPGDVTRLAQAIDELCSSERLPQIMRHNREQSKLYTTDRFIHQMADVCWSVCNKGL